MEVICRGVATAKQEPSCLGWHRDVRGRLIAGEDVGVKALGLLRQCLGQLGATPADASKVQMPPADDVYDPASKYF
jgi:hypothetical protein